MKKTPFILSLIAALAVATTTVAKDQLTNQHVDVGIAYEDGEWDLHVHNETDDVEYEPNKVVLVVGSLAKTTVPADPAFAFLGAPGSDIWVLSQVQNPALMFLGIAAEEIPDGVFTGNQLQLALKSVKGPGDFAVFSVDGFGQPVVGFNSGDGIDASDSVNVLTGGHTDYNWSFSKPGRYRMTVEATGTLVSGETISSGPVTYTFSVERRARKN
jgi:surface-anchored protein